MSIWIEMAVGPVDHLHGVPDAFRDQVRGEAHVDQ